jgi:hypothetical protein
VSTVSIDSSALRAHVTVAAPGNATISVNGVAVGTGNWRADTLRPGNYEFAAALPDAPEGCASARARTSRALRPGRAVQAITLAPRPCGLVTFEAEPATARYALIPVTADGARFDGVLPLPSPLLVPAGVYRLTVADRYCSQFTNDSLVVAAERTTRQPKIRLICQRP